MANLPRSLLLRVSASTLDLRPGHGSSAPLPSGVTNVGQVIDLGYEIVSLASAAVSEKDVVLVALRRVT